MAGTRTARVVDIRVVLPEQWWAIPLQLAQARERSVQRLVERQFSGVDDQPLLREDLRKQLLRQAEQAAVSDARMLALSLHRVDGIPIPASLVVHWIDLPPHPSATPGDGLLLLGLRDQLDPGSTPPPGFNLDIGGLDAGAVLRRVHERSAGLEGAEPTQSLVAGYWLERPDGTGIVQLAFGTPVLVLREPLLELFDAIVGTLRWVTTDER